MKISNRVREQVVELLRCAVDTRSSLLYTNCELGGTIRTRALAFGAYDAVPYERDAIRQILEAALRVEQGWTPWSKATLARLCP